MSTAGQSRSTPTATIRAGYSPPVASSRDRSSEPVPDASTTTRAGTCGGTRSGCCTPGSLIVGVGRPVRGRAGRGDVVCDEVFLGVVERARRFQFGLWPGYRNVLCVEILDWWLRFGLRRGFRLPHRFGRLDAMGDATRH